ncbi:NAD(P)-dependent oxidoreductase [Allonocardiopsis opalescens]|uniref:3-hydroxyisobutyrate dehydrogenase-like beta-hydroxyacid dehydrogenase n=1 Tax=Allonocardiopsis opalescens TaxID=1144618 RepID=A0A2T0PVV9_9ACTN|nr:NAD(P)-binding domain-containing protein [Allonocardiopsis opalescens]PRX95676.1 3-hydroxyisobutyrate dehydrogenase-like beta-hydroxyacid dehydrogenase [Allonocardiopsis opalescens]
MSAKRSTDTGRDSVAVLGLGPMGRALAGAFVAAGHPTTVWNRSAGKADELVARGATLAADPAEAAEAADLIVVCVLDYDAVQDILDGAADRLAGRTVVNLTADTPARARSMAEWAAKRDAAYLDGAIMTPTITIGGDDAVVLYSGPQDVYDAARPALAALGGTATFLGEDPGRAAAYDVALLDLFWTTVYGYMHAIALARTEGVTAEDLLPYSAGIVALVNSVMTPEYVRQIDERRFDPDTDSAIRSQAATLRHIVQAGRDRGLDVGMQEAALRLVAQVIAEGHGDSGFERVIEAIERPAPAAG